MRAYAVRSSSSLGRWAVKVADDIGEVLGLYRTIAYAPTKRVADRIVRRVEAGEAPGDVAADEMDKYLEQR